MSVLIPLLAFQASGCYVDGTLTSRKEVRPQGSHAVAYGSELTLKKTAETADVAGVQVGERTVCRKYDEGDTYTVSERTKLERKAPLWWGLSSILVGGGIAFLGAQAGQNGEKGSDPTVAAGVAVGVFGLALIATYIILPGTKTETTEKLDEHWKRWTAAYVPCGDDLPLQQTTQLQAELTPLSGGAPVGVLAVSTDEQGAFEGPLLASVRRAAAYCGPLRAIVSDASGASSVDDTPTAPRVVAQRHAKPIGFDVSFSGERPTIAAIAQVDAKAAQVARSCCAASVTTREHEPCVQRCIEAGAANKCSAGARACQSRAAGGEFASLGKERCDQLFSDCLLAHGTSTSALSTCVEFCVNKSATEVCK